MSLIAGLREETDEQRPQVGNLYQYDGGREMAAYITDIRGNYIYYRYIGYEYTNYLTRVLFIHYFNLTSTLFQGELYG